VINYKPLIAMEDNHDDDSNNDSDSDEWGMEELVIPSLDQPPKGPASELIGDDGTVGNNNSDDDDDWAVRRTTIDKKEIHDTSSNDSEPLSSSHGEAMIIVDFTQLDPNIHSRFDRASVNDSEGASVLRKQIESEYSRYATDAELLADGTVIPCGSSVWRAALVQLRDDRQGHYFVPIFPPKSTTNI
jgi:hypothetical protein